MKKIYKSLSLIAFVAVCNNAMAQGPTITSIAMPQIGYVYNMVSDTFPTDLPTFTVSAGSGSAQTWNYTTQFGTTYADPLSFVSPASGTGSSNFPGANMASDVNGNWAYWVSGPSGLFVDGFYGIISGTPTALDFTPNPVEIPFPFSYANTPVVTTYTTTFLVSGLTVKQYVTRTLTPDAFGSLTTPGGTFANTLRTKKYETTVDSIFTGTFFLQAQWDTTTSYGWWQNAANAAIMSIDMNKTGAPTKAQYMQSFTTGVMTANKPSASFKLFPNPASGVTHLTYENKTSGKVNLELIDAMGKQVAVLVNEVQSAGQQELSIDLAAMQLPKGLYFLQLNSGDASQTIKLNVN